jgi:uncharacterized protein
MSDSEALTQRFIEIIATDIEGEPAQVEAADRLLRDGCTVCFIARFRKDLTGGLRYRQLDILARRRRYFLELQARRDEIITSAEEQGMLTPELTEALAAVTNREQLEDLAMPFRSKRSSRAEEAYAKGLAPLADALFESAGTTKPPAGLAKRYINAELGVADAKEALKGARDIIAERISETAEHRGRLREAFKSSAKLKVKVQGGKEEEGAAFRDYFDHSESVRSIPSHRLLAILRGEREGFLLTSIEVDDAREVKALATAIGVPLNTPCGVEIANALADGYVRLLKPAIATEIMGKLRERAENEAIEVFRANLEAVLMQPPMGRVPVIGINPGARSSCRLAVVSGDGEVLATSAIPQVKPDTDMSEAAAGLLDLVKSHEVKAIAVASGNGGRETEAFLRKTLMEAGLDKVVVTTVAETGAGAYSTSKLARMELPDLKTGERCAVSLARRLQDPLIELVKVDPRTLGVGQYQHDVDQSRLAVELRQAVESVVNRVGVDLNTAPVSLLRYVSGISEPVAKAIIAHRDDNGPFTTLQDLLSVAKLEPLTFQVAAGFLRLRNGDNPLDRTGVHPERYPVVEAMADKLGITIGELVGNHDQLVKVRLEELADQENGLGRLTLTDIRSDLEVPGFDPRPRFRVPRWSPEVAKLDDLKPGMNLEGRVSNVTSFGAFVDIGLHQHGLVHLSELPRMQFADLHEVVRIGDVVAVKVTGVDMDRERISLSMKLPQPGANPERERRPPRGRRQGPARERQRGPRDRGRPPRGKRPEPRHATIDDLISKFGGKKIG